MKAEPTSRASERATLRLAISPCPNDTFAFHQIATGALRLDDTDLSLSLHDVETLNQAALEGEFDITKLSFHAFLLVQDRYELLQTGAALGRGCGPLLVSSRPLAPCDLPSCRIAVPGTLTTAHLLLRLFCPEAKNRVFTRYDEIIGMVASGLVDCGVIIHEDRFVYETAGLFKVVDLGEWWEGETGQPIPLGCMAMRRPLTSRYADAFDALVRESIRRAREDTEAALPYIRTHARQMERSVLMKHIATFVSDHTSDLGSDGKRAIHILREMAVKAGVIK